MALMHFRCVIAPPNRDMEKSARKLENYDLVIYSISEDEDHSFITSDSPTCLPGFHPLHFNSYISNEVFFPVDRNHAFRFMPSNQPNRIHRIDASKENVMWINALTVDNAHEKIVGRSKEDINEALKYFTSKNI